jgi:tetratricopeptide (TPR) repeat protein
MKLSYYPFLALSFFLVSIASAQESQPTRRIDTLVKLLPKKKGSGKFEAFKDLFSLYSQFDYAKSYEVSLDALTTATELKDSLLIIKAYRMKGFALSQLTKNVEAILTLFEALKMAEAHTSDPKIKEQIKYILNSIAAIYTDTGNYPRALEYNFKSLVTRQEDGNKADESIALNNIGLIYYRMEDYQKAIDFYEKCLGIRREINDKGDNNQLILINLALCHIAVDQFEKAISTIKEALIQCENDCSVEIKREAFNAFGILYIKINEIEKAESYLSKSLDIAKSQNNIPSMASNLIYLSNIERKKGKSRAAIKLLDNAEKVLLNVDYPKLKLDLCTAFYEVYQSERKFDLASSYQNRYIMLNNLINKGLLKDLREVQTSYAERENIKTIASQKQILDLNAQLITRQKQQTIFIAAIALLLLLLAGVFYKNYRDKSIANRRLDEKVKERTEELRVSHHRLDKSFNLQQLTMQQVWQEGLSILGSIKGLCHVAQLDLQEVKAKEYMTKVDHNTGRLAALLARLNG